MAARRPEKGLLSAHGLFNGVHSASSAGWPRPVAVLVEIQ
jgi:hypothetical protein